MRVLEVQNVTKRFDGVTAIDGLDMSLSPGRIRGVIGPNGSGKTTLINLISGLLQPTEGSILFDGIDITRVPTHKLTRLGVARTFQIPRVLPDLTCLENVMLGRHCRHGFDLWGTWLRAPLTASKQEKSIKAKAFEVMEETGMIDSAHRLGGELSWMEEQLLQISRALISQPRLLLLDEPTAGMGEAESLEVQAVIRRIAQSGVTTVVVAHDMRLIKELAEEVTCISFGTKIADGVCQAVLDDPKVNEVYLGAD